jgi:hypothetical protein
MGSLQSMAHSSGSRPVRHGSVLAGDAVAMSARNLWQPAQQDMIAAAEILLASSLSQEARRVVRELYERLTASDARKEAA